MRGKPFEVGNTFGKGRPRGSRNERTALVELMKDHGEAIIKQCQVLALKGDRTALRLCMERLIPPCEAANSRFRLPPMKTMADLKKALAAVGQEVARGRLSAEEGELMSRMIASQGRIIDSVEFEKRLRALEKARKLGSRQRSKKL
jgi:hypothetical protein